MKKVKRKQIDEKIKKLKDDFNRNDSYNLFKSVRKLEGRPKKNLKLVKNQKKDKSTKTEALKIWEKHF